MEYKEGVKRLMARRIKPIIIGTHPSLYSKMEELRKMYESQIGQKLSQMELTNIISKRIKLPKKINLIEGGLYEKNIKKKRRSY